MKAFAVTNHGIETVAAAEIGELTDATNISPLSGVISFDAEDFRDFCTLAYRSQSLSRVCCFVCEFEVAASLSAAVKVLKKNMENFKISDWVSDDDSFVVECERNGSHGFSSLDFATAANKMIAEISGSNNVSFKSPLLRFYCYINDNKGFFGIDVAGFDLSKREYRIFGHASDLKATVAYALVRLSGFTPGKKLLDPFCRSGAVSIEAALFASGFPVNYYRKDAFSFLKLKPFSKIDFEKLFSAVDRKIKTCGQQVFNYSPSISHLASSEKNAKIAGVNKFINFSRVDIEWLELKFEHEDVDFIVSFPPLLSKNTDSASVKRLYSEFFYQAGLTLSKKGKIVLATRDAEAFADAAVSRRFHLCSKAGFSMGSEKFLALVFVRD